MFFSTSPARPSITHHPSPIRQYKHRFARGTPEGTNYSCSQAKKCLLLLRTRTSTIGFFFADNWLFFTNKKEILPNVILAIKILPSVYCLILGNLIFITKCIIGQISKNSNYCQMQSWYSFETKVIIAKCKRSNVSRFYFHWAIPWVATTIMTFLITTNMLCIYISRY